MITFQEAYDIVISHAPSFGDESVPIIESVGRILKEDITADRDFPPFDRVTMDGIAVHFDGSQSNTELKIEGVGAAGSPQLTLNDPKSCLEIMTGAVLPQGTDTIIRYEDVTIQNGVATIDVSYKKGQNIHRQGEDRSKGEVLLSKGKKLGSEDIGILATVGKTTLEVSRLPKVLVISTGDELVELEDTPLPHQIRKSNIYQIVTTLLDFKIQAEYQHLTDDAEIIETYLKRALQEYDAIILSGGVSKGKFDHIPNVLAKLGVEKYFHRVKQRPGKPFWFGRYKDECTIFALPGNPVSSYMCTQVYLKSWLMQGLEIEDRSTYHAVLAEDVHFAPDLTYFLEVKVSTNERGHLIATPMKGNGSGDLANLSKANAFIKLPQGLDTFQKGEVHPIFLFSHL